MQKEYPFILIPPAIEAIFQEFPPIHPSPQIPPEPILVLTQKPNAPIFASKPVHPGKFTKLPPRKTSLISLFISELGVVLITFLIQVITDSQIAGFSTFIFLTALVIIFGVTRHRKYTLQLKEFNREKIDYEKKINRYKFTHDKWKHQVETQVLEYQHKLQICEANNSKERQKHQRETREWQQNKNELERNYQSQKEATITPEKVAEWRQKKIKQRLASLQPTPLGVRVTDIDRRGYAEFPNNCSFSNLLERYFGSKKIHALRYMNDKIPDFAYVDKVNNLYIDIEIDEPYTPRQYPHKSELLTVIHCLEQNEYENRDRLFTDSDWFVIHFSEKQIICWTESCCKHIAKTIYELTGDSSVLSQLDRVRDLQTEPRWTKQKAEAMANRQERLSYEHSHSLTNANKPKIKTKTKRHRECREGTVNNDTPISKLVTVKCPQCNANIEHTKLEIHKRTECKKNHL